MNRFLPGLVCLILAVSATPPAFATSGHLAMGPVHEADSAAARRTSLRLHIERTSKQKVNLIAYRLVKGSQPFPWTFRVKAKVRSKIIKRRMRTTMDGGPGSITLPVRTKWVAVKDARSGWKRKSVPPMTSDPNAPAVRVLDVEAYVGDSADGPAVFVNVTTRGVTQIGIRGVQLDGTTIDESHSTDNGDTRTSVEFPPTTQSVWVRVERPQSASTGWKKKWTAPPLQDWQQPHRGPFTAAEASEVRVRIINQLNQLRASARTCPSTPVQSESHYPAQPPLPEMPDEWVRTADASYLYFGPAVGWFWAPVITPNLQLGLTYGGSFGSVAALLDDIQHPDGIDIWCHPTMQANDAYRLIVALQRSSHSRNNQIEVGLYMGGESAH